MNWAHVHLLLNHIPVIGMGLGVLLYLYAFARKSDELILASLKLFVLLAIVTVPTYLTGDPAGEVVSPLPGVTKQIIERHDDAATVALIGTSVLGAAALAGWLIFRRKQGLPRWLSTGVLVLSVAVGGWLAYTANLGGEIRHTEIRAEQTPTLGQAGAPDRTAGRGHLA